MKHKLNIENIPISYQILGGTGTLLGVNSSWLKMLGYCKDEVLGQNFTSFLSENSIPIFEKNFHGQSNSEICKVSLQIKHKNGEWYWFEINGNDIKNEDGSYKETHCALINANEQQSRENLRYETEERFTKLFQQSPHGIGIIQINGVISRTNDRFCKMLNYPPGELENKDLRDISHHDDLAPSLDNFQRLINQEVPTTTQIKRYITRDGACIWVEVISSVINNSIGEIQYVIVTVEDITKRRISELSQKIVYNISNAVGTSDSLEELIKIIKTQLSRLIDTTNFFVATYDQINDQFLLPYYSDEFEDEEFHSFPRGKSVSNYVFETKKPLLATPSVLKELESKNEIELIGPPSKIWLGIPLIFKGEIFGVMAVQSYDDENAFSAVDLELLEHVSQQISISVARKKSEDELRIALMRAKEADKIKSTFLSTMSHELRTPLNAVIGFSELLVDELEDHESGHFAEIIHSSGNHLLELVEGLFDITLIESGNIKIRKNKYTLQTLLNTVLNLILAEQKKMGIKELSVELESKDLDNFVVFTDAIKLKQILINLLKNALKFTKKGKIVFGCTVPKKDSEMLTFYVKDTGIGIPKDKLDFIFDSFNQIDGRHSRQHDGAGIGLSVAKQLAQLLGGKIWVSSIVGKGSEFHFTICHN